VNFTELDGFPGVLNANASQKKMTVSLPYNQSPEMNNQPTSFLFLSGFEYSIMPVQHRFSYNPTNINSTHITYDITLSTDGVLSLLTGYHIVYNSASS
jgi:hypothetical protein